MSLALRSLFAVTGLFWTAAGFLLLVSALGKRELSSAWRFAAAVPCYGVGIACGIMAYAIYLTELALILIFSSGFGLSVLSIKAFRRQKQIHWKARATLVLLLLLTTIGNCGWVIHVRKHRSPPGLSGWRSVTQAEMRQIARALESYYIDNNSYPPAVNRNGKTVLPDENGISSGNLSSILTTPMAYLTSLPTDHFHRDRKTRELMDYQYSSKLRKCWVLASFGPDRDLDSNLKELTPLCGKDGFWGDAFHACQYDPTNGALSSGDLFWVGP